MSRLWTPSPLLKTSLAVHAGAVIGSTLLPNAWPWALGSLALNHGVITLAGLLPRAKWLGPNITRLDDFSMRRRSVAITIDDGPDRQVTPKVLDILDAAGVKATFFCIGQRAKQAPALCRRIVECGHRVENHGYAHSNVFSLFGPKRIRSDIQAAQACLSDITGQSPRYFRPTAGLRNPFLEPVLAELDLHLVTWTRRPFDTIESNSNIVKRRLLNGLGPGDILLLHDGHVARDAKGQPVIFSVLPDLLEHIKSQRLYPITLTAAFT